MERVSGTFRREGRLVVEGADIFLHVGVSGSQTLWYGSFELPPDAEMGDADVYDLELEDGRHGRVTVARARVRSGYRCGGFTGNGPLHEAEESR
jgi:hypothetical protein